MSKSGGVATIWLRSQCHRWQRAIPVKGGCTGSSDLVLSNPTNGTHRRSEPLNASPRDKLRACPAGVVNTCRGCPAASVLLLILDFARRLSDTEMVCIGL